MESYCEHPAINPKEYVRGLYVSWNKGKPNQVFQFLVEQADQKDLDEAKEGYTYENYPEYSQAIDKALKVALPTGSRIISVEKVHRVLAVLAPITSASDKYRPCSIIEEYLLGEKERTKKCESGGQEADAEDHTD